jgi:myo-inositol-1(or 4)-monophosphatase
MHPYLNVAIKAARSAGRVIVDAILHPGFTYLNRKSTDAIINTVTRIYPEHNIITPENNGSLDQSNINWIIDPLNGSYNFTRGLPFFAVSIGVIDAAGNVEHAVVYNPAYDELFVASKGSGTQLNNKKIRCSTNPKPEEALVAINLNLLHSQTNQGKNIVEPMNNRYIGCPAIHLAFVAAGRLDGYCDYNLHPWDLAAGILLVKESGGYVTDFNGRIDVLNNGNVISANTKMHSKLLESLQ